MFGARRALRLRTYEAHSYALVRTAVVRYTTSIWCRIAAAFYILKARAAAACVRVCVRRFLELQVVVVVLSVDRWLTIDLVNGYFSLYTPHAAYQVYEYEHIDT